MSVYARFKRDHDGFRKLVELLESTAPSRRQKMIDVGMAEDAEYTKKALEYVMDFNDVLKLPDLELAEVCAKARPEMIAYSLNGKEKTVIDRFLGCCPAKTAIQVRDLVEAKIGPREIAGGQMKLVEAARELERKGLVRTKIIPFKV